MKKWFSITNVEQKKNHRYISSEIVYTSLEDFEGSRLLHRNV